MPLEKQVVSLELAKELKDLGYPQESLFYWKPDGGWHLSQKRGVLSISAPTAGELGEIFPKCEIKLYNKSSDRKIVQVHLNGNYYEDEAETEVDARAKMLIYLLKNKLITI